MERYMADMQDAVIAQKKHFPENRCIELPFTASMAMKPEIRASLPVAMCTTKNMVKGIFNIFF